MSEPPLPSPSGAARRWAFRAMAVCHFERPLVTAPPLVRPRPAAGWSLLGWALLAAALLLWPGFTASG